MASTHTNSRRLIEDWFPVNEISIEAIRERAGAASHCPGPHQLHVWWARRPLAHSRGRPLRRCCQAHQHLQSSTTSWGHTRKLWTSSRISTRPRSRAYALEQGFSKPRAFTHNLSKTEREWLHQNLVTDNPTVLDITAGGGSIPFEASRLGFRTIANELNPVAGLILRATCEWPQKYGWGLQGHFQEVRGRFLDKVRELTADLYPEEPQPEGKAGTPQDGEVRAKRYVWAYLFARTVTCPSCEGTIPLSPNWRLDSKGTGIRVVPDTTSGTCTFEIVTRASDQSPGTISRAKATCPYPTCGATTPTGYISTEAQAGRLGHQLYCVIYRDSWYPTTKSGRLSKRPKTSRGFRVSSTGGRQHRGSGNLPGGSDGVLGKGQHSAHRGRAKWGQDQNTHQTMECPGGATCSAPASFWPTATASKPSTT